MAKSGYEVYLKDCLLPVAPKKLQVKINNGNKTAVLINGGEVSLLKAAGLTDIEFECEIPQSRRPYAACKPGFKGAGYYMGVFEALKTGKKPFQFIVCRRLPNGRQLLNTNIKVSMEDYKITEEAKNGFDFSVKVRLKQYKAYATKTVAITEEGQKLQAAVESPREADGSPAPAASQPYTVAKGDCLWTIAKKFYGNGAKYTAIYNANKGVIGGNPNLIYPGQSLTIPAA